MALGQRRATAVKNYLLSQGVPANKIYTESKGKSNPVASNATAEGRSQNRRVDIEVVGTK
jgi:OOP family OmpA-OmpF porin